MTETELHIFLLNNYQLFRALHIIAVIAWMAGLLYLPRLFVYHVDAGKEGAAMLQVMERRLLRFIMNPAMIAAWIFGLLMIWANTGLLSNGWMHVKLTAVVAMTVVHHIYGRWRKSFERGQNQKPAKFYKIWNEVPTVLMIIIVFMAVTEPF
ncbi:MAG: protoporphyrinogen oxidase HemJ [Rhodospirillales bacterium]|nr:protoporphyrinogen oxidase HemJ [Rhodospirillales bacterium]MCB9997009.1 protoporphyrinogen oxidase HemJ [Rhodospirillales bacterium]